MQKKTSFIIVASLVLTVLGVTTAAADTSVIREDADYYGEMGMDHLNAGELDKGMKLLNLATQTNPYDPRWHMQYAQVLNRVGSEFMKKGDHRSGRHYFKNAEREMIITANILIRSGDAENAANIFYQLGELNRNVFHKKFIAQGFYKKALELSPEHTGALQAMGAPGR